MAANVISNQLSSLFHLRQKPTIKAFLEVIAYAEGTNGNDGYYKIYGVQNNAKNLKDHPGRIVCELSRGKKLCSTAAGRYQFLHTTWDDLAKKYDLKDFGPISQDVAAIALLESCGALKALENKNFESAVKKASKIWASLPGSPYGQPIKTMEELKQVFTKECLLFNTGRTCHEDLSLSREKT